MKVRMATKLWLALAAGLLSLAAPVAIAAQWTTNVNDVYKTNTAGNVGIGTTSPGVAIDVVNSVTAGTGTARFKNTNANTQVIIDTAASQNANLRFDKNASPFWYLGNEASNDRFRFLNSNSNGNVEVFTILQGGNVGVGTTNPTARFVIANGNFGLGTNSLATWTQQTSVIESLDTSVFFGTDTDIGLNSNAYHNAGWKYKKADAAANVHLYKGNIYFRTATTGTADAPLTWTNAMFITSAGNVGIGTTNPTALLSVSKNQASGTEIRIDNSNAAGFAGLYMNGGFAGATGGFVQYNNISGFRNLFVGTAGSEPLYLGTENSVRMTVLPGSGNVGIGKADPQYKLEVVGDIKASGTIHAKYQDLAEWVPSSEQLSAGTVVVLDTTKSNQVVSSGTAYDTRVAGVISVQPGITLGESGEGKVLVATTGRVRVKVDASRGPIQIGDLLVTSDVAGVAMKSEPVEFAGRKMHMPGTIIGKALEPLAKGSGEILVLLSLQ